MVSKSSATTAESTMYRRQHEVPIYERLDATVEALHFGSVQTALRRKGPEIRLTIPSLHYLDLILQADAWIIVDRSLSDLPVSAWTQFATQGRSELHTPVACQLWHFHFNAPLISNRVLEAMELILGEQLLHSDVEARVLPFRPKEP